MEPLTPPPSFRTLQFRTRSRTNSLSSQALAALSALRPGTPDKLMYTVQALPSQSWFKNSQNKAPYNQEGHRTPSRGRSRTRTRLSTRNRQELSIAFPLMDSIPRRSSRILNVPTLSPERRKLTQQDEDELIFSMSPVKTKFPHEAFEHKQEERVTAMWRSKGVGDARRMTNRSKQNRSHAMPAPVFIHTLLRPQKDVSNLKCSKTIELLRTQAPVSSDSSDSSDAETDGRFMYTFPKLHSSSLEQARARRVRRSRNDFSVADVTLHKVSSSATLQTGLDGEPFKDEDILPTAFRQSFTDERTEADGYSFYSTNYFPDFDQSGRDLQKEALPASLLSSFPELPPGIRSQRDRSVLLADRNPVGGFHFKTGHVQSSVKVKQSQPIPEPCAGERSGEDHIYDEKLDTASILDDKDDLEGQIYLGRSLNVSERADSEAHSRGW